MSYAISINDTQSARLSWVKLLGLGILDTRDDRGPYLVLNPESIVALTRKQSVDGAIVIDLDHSVDTQAIHGQPTPAAGFAVDFQVRDDGIYGKIDWTALGKSAIDRFGRNGERAYRAISPVFEFDPVTREVKSLLRAGLTNQPNLKSMDIAICSTQTTSHSTRKKTMTITEKIAALRAEMAVNSTRHENTEFREKREKLLQKLHDEGGVMSAAEKRVASHFMNVSEGSFVEGAIRQAARDAKASEVSFDIRPFILDKLPPVRFEG